MLALQPTTNRLNCEVSSLGQTKHRKEETKTQMSIYLVTEGYNEDIEIVAAFPTLKAAKAWITKEATRRQNQDDSYTLQYFTNWFHIHKIPLYEEPGHITKTELEESFMAKYYLKPATYKTLEDISNLLVNFLESPPPKDQQPGHP